MEIKLTIPEQKRNDDLEKSFKSYMSKMSKIMDKKPPKVDVSGIERQIASLKKSIKQPDNSALLKRLARMEKMISKKDDMKSSLADQYKRYVSSIKQPKPQVRTVLKTVKVKSDTSSLVKAVNKNSEAVRKLSDYMGKQMIPSPS